MGRTARTTLRSAPLCAEFGRDYATYLFGAEAVASLPLFTRGDKKGQPKGWINWLRTTEAGYHPNAGRAVAADTTVRVWITEHQGAPESSAMFGFWHGRTQNLAGSMSVLGDEGRERRARDVANAAADRAALLAQVEGC